MMGGRRAGRIDGEMVSRFRKRGLSSGKNGNIREVDRRKARRKC